MYQGSHQIIDPEVWRTNHEKEPETSTHPCDDPSPSACMCKGACSCHWAQQSDARPNIQLLRLIAGMFQWGCFVAGVNTTAFAAFGELMNKHIDLVERATTLGIDFEQIPQAEHLPLVAVHDVEYLAALLKRVFGPVVNSSPMMRLAFHQALFGESPK